MTTPRLGLQTVPSNSLQPSAPVNDTLQALDALAQGSVVSALQNTPPATTDSDAGRAWIVGSTPTGAWSGHGFTVALCTAAGEWRFLPPMVGMTFYVQDQGVNFVYHSTGWGPSPRVSTKTASANLALSDADVIQMTAASANTLTLLDDSLVPIKPGRSFRVVQKGTGATSIAAASGVAIRTAGSLTLGARYASGLLTKVGDNEWLWTTSGGITSIVAGSGVSVDNTDPGNPVVSAGGGGGGGGGGAALNFPWLFLPASRGHVYYIGDDFSELAMSAQSLPNDRLVLFPFMVPRDTTIATYGLNLSSASVGQVGRVGIYANSVVSGRSQPGALLYSSGDLSLSTTGPVTDTAGFTLTAGTLYWGALLSNGYVNVVGTQPHAVMGRNFAGSGDAVSYVAQTGLSGWTTLPSSVTINASYTNTGRPCIFFTV